MPGFAGYIGTSLPAPKAPPSMAAAAEPTRKLHPLHTVEFLVQQIQNTGTYPNPERATGRTTLLALKAIVAALESPHKVIHVRDHHDTMNSHKELIRLIHDLTRMLGLVGFHCSPSMLTVTFGNAN